MLRVGMQSVPLRGASASRAAPGQREKQRKTIEQKQSVSVFSSTVRRDGLQEPCASMRQQVQTLTARKERECQPCTACCDGWVRMVIAGIPVYPGCPCPHSTGSGCDDYDNRPIDPCAHFNCGWIVEGSPLPEWMKPSNGKVIVFFNKMVWRGHQVDLAAPVGRRIPPRSLNWLKTFSEKNARLLIYTEQIREAGRFQKEQLVFGHGPPAFQEALRHWQREGKKLW